MSSPSTSQEFPVAAIGASSMPSILTSRENAAGLRDLPNLNLILGQIEEQLGQRSHLGVLSVTVIRRIENSDDDHWNEYEGLLREISVFIADFARRGLRQSDILLEPILAGNTFVALLGPPRKKRVLDRTDMAAVRYRLMIGVNAHLQRTLSHRVTERFGIYVGCSIMHDNPEVSTDRIVYRGLEESIADALGQQKRETRLQGLHLRRILQTEQVRTVYQPVVDVVDKRVIGYEALTRPPQDHFQSPDLLFRAAHREGVLWPLERLCRARALDNMPRLEEGQYLFLNTEPDSLFDPALRESGLLDQLARVGLDPHHVVLEITEHVAVKDYAALRRVLNEIREMGFLLAIDDVGSGYAGLQAIAEMRPDYLKVDMTLVRDMHLDTFKQELIATIRRFSDNTGIVLVAEGVESIAELESLSQVGVRCAQGYLFARPDSPPIPPDWDWLRK